MSSVFSLSRLGKLVTKQIFEQGRLYLYSVLALFGLLSLVFSFWITTSDPRFYEQATYMIFIFGLFIAGTVFASLSFNMLGSKDKGIYWLSIPATHLEKLVCTIFFTTIVFTAVYCLVFFIVKSIAVSFLQGYYIKNHPGFSYVEMKDFEHGFGAALKYFIYAYFGVQAAYLLGSVYFNRYSYIITSVFGALLIFVFVYYISKIEDTVLADANWDLISVRKLNGGMKNSYFVYSVSTTTSTILQYTLQFALAPVLWMITWFRLKEKEI